jgi:hypothetical protein
LFADVPQDPEGRGWFERDALKARDIYGEARHDCWRKMAIAIPQNIESPAIQKYLM